MQYRKGTFITVPNKQVLYGLDPQSQVLFMWLNSFSNEDGECYPSIERLSEACGMSQDTVIRRMAVLEEKGFIKKEPQFVENRQTTNLYTVQLIDGVADSYPGGSHTDTHGGSTERHRTKYIGTESIKNSVSNETAFSIEIDEPEKVTRKPKDKTALALREELYTIFEKERGVRPTPTFSDYNQVLNALKRLTKAQIIDMVERDVNYTQKRTVREILTARGVDIYLQENA